MSQPDPVDINHPPRHRGANSEDVRLFAPPTTPVLREAVADLSWLLGRGYAPMSAVEIVGNRYGLHARQRIAVSRASSSALSMTRRTSTLITPVDVAGRALIVDGFNLLITIEAALSGGVILVCRDGCYRDVASVHGSYRSVEETDRALDLIGSFFERLAPASVAWMLDRPVSNSGRLRARIAELAVIRGWNWTVDTVMSPDKVLMASSDIVVSSDSLILDNCVAWVNVARLIVDSASSTVWLVDLS